MTNLSCLSIIAVRLPLGPRHQHQHQPMSTRCSMTTRSLRTRQAVQVWKIGTRFSSPSQVVIVFRGLFYLLFLHTELLVESLHTHPRSSRWEEQGITKRGGWGGGDQASRGRGVGEQHWAGRRSGLYQHQIRPGHRREKLIRGSEHTQEERRGGRTIAEDWGCCCCCC